MNRRDFLLTSTAAASLAVLGTRAADASSDDVLRALVRAHDEQIPKLLARQERRVGHRWIGGISNEHGIHTVADTNRKRTHGNAAIARGVPVSASAPYPVRSRQRCPTQFAPAAKIAA